MDEKPQPTPVNYGGKVYGDIEFTSAIEGVILIAPNGTRYRVLVSDAGALTVTAI